MNFPISRRTMLLASSGMIVAGTWRPQAALAREAKALTFWTTDPRNGEPKLEQLVGQWQTPTSHFYVRSHAPNPQIDVDAFRLRVEGLVGKPLSLSLNDLQKFTPKSTMATLTCAGNRRAEYNREGKVGGVQWQAGAIGNAQWGGVPLAEVLRAAEVKPDGKHVWFEGLDEIPKSGKIIPFGGSIPMEKAMISNGAGAPLLTTQMNGAPLEPDHGYPLRMVVPGYIGARSVKWLGKITVSDRPSPNHYVATAYKIVKDTSAVSWAESGPIYRYPVNAAICTPTQKSQAKPGRIDVTGYALPTGRPGSTIKEVLVSADRGKTWVEAELTGKSSEFCWQLWKASVKAKPETKRLMVKASDTSGNFMPARVPWNAKGYLQNSWYRLPIRIEE